MSQCQKPPCVYVIRGGAVFMSVSLCGSAANVNRFTEGPPFGIKGDQRPKAPPSMRISNPMATNTTGRTTCPQRDKTFATTGRVAK